MHSNSIAHRQSPKKCNFKRWNLVLEGAESDPKFQEALAHVENCTDCQARVELTAINDTPWWGEAKQSWLEQELPTPNADSSNSSIIIEIEPEMPDDSRIEFETIALTFLEPPSHPELLGRLGRYEIERVIGKGGMGIVLKAHDTELHRVVAIKVLAEHLANNASARKRFAREAQAAAAVLHPNVIPIYNVESDGSTPYLVMQCVAGSSLQSKVDRHGPLPLADTLRIAKQTAAGLSAAHDQGLVHRDVKPANILLEECVDRVLLSDFGLARAVDDASMTRTGVVAGTPHYMSPEQARGDAIDTRSDQFSLGSVMYFMLTGRPPFRASGAMGVLNRICTEQHRSIEQINQETPVEVSQLIDRLMMKNAADRFASMQLVEKEMERLLAALQTGGLSLAKRKRQGRSLVKKLLWGAVASGFIAMMVIGANAIWHSRPQNQRAAHRSATISRPTSVEMKTVQEQIQAAYQSDLNWMQETLRMQSDIQTVPPIAANPSYPTDQGFEATVHAIQSQIDFYERQYPSSNIGDKK